MKKPLLFSDCTFNLNSGLSISRTSVKSGISSVYLIILLLVGSSVVIPFSALAGKRYAVASASWNSTSTWSATSGGAAGASIPTASDSVYIFETNTVRSVTIPSAYNATCAYLSLYGGTGYSTVLTFTNGTSTLTVNGDVNIPFPPGGYNERIINIGPGVCTVSGDFNYGVGNNGSSASRLTTVKITTGTLTILGDLIYHSGATTQHKMDMTGGAGTLNLAGNIVLTYNVGTILPGTTGTVNFNGTSPQTLNLASSLNYNHVNINNTTGVTLGAAITTTDVIGNLRVQSGFLSNGGFAVAGAAADIFEVANGATFNLTGTSAMVTGFTKTFGATSTVNYAGSAQTVASATYGNLTLSGSGVKTMPGAFTIAGNFTMSGTASATAAGALTIGGDVTLGSGTTFNASSYTHNLAGDFADNGATFSSTGTFNLNGTAAQAIGGTDASISFNNLTIANTTAAVSVNINTNVSGTLNLNGAATVITPSATVVFNNSAAAGTITGTGTVQVTRLIATASYSSQYKFTTNTLTNLTVEYAGEGNQVVTGSTYSALKISGSGSKVCSGALVVNGTLEIASGGTLDLATYTLTGTLTTLSGTGSLKTQNTSATPIPVSKTWPFTIFYNSASAQTIVLGTYDDLDGSGGNRTLPSSTVNITGTLISGSGTYTTTGNTINYSSASAQTIGAFAYNNLTVSGGAIKTVGGSVTVANNLTISANTTLALGSNNITLKSDATNTARLALVPTTASITYGTGKFIAERYVGSGRKYRLITSPVTTGTGTLTVGQESQSIWGNWQNSQVNTSNIGTLITGGTSAGGFDTQTPSASLYTYDATTKRFVGFTSANGKNTKYTPLKAGVGYYMFVYGDRLNTVNATTPNNTVLQASGTLLIGNQTYNTSSSIPLSGVTGNFTLIGNPFASPIDWNTVTKSNVSNIVYGWDRNLAGTGGFVTVSISILGQLISPLSSIIGFNQYVQSGQAFFVKTTGANPSVVIKESDKVTNNNTTAFRTAPNSIPLIAVNLLYPSGGTSLLADGALEAYDSSFSNDLTDEDATKFVGSTEGVGIVEGGDLLSINTRKMHHAGDTIFLNLTRITKPRYTLQILAQQLDNTVGQPYLEDTYLNTSVPLLLGDTNTIAFTVKSTDAASFAADRFRIVFKSMTILPVTFTTIQASAKEKYIQVEWNVASENGVEKYEIQRSADGINFSKAAEVNAKGSAGDESYQWLDTAPFTGSNHYRVRAIHHDGKAVFTKVVMLKISASDRMQLLVYPNPINNQQIKFQFNAIEKGTYTFVLHNAQGQRITTRSFEHKGGTVSQAFQLNSKLARGMYYLKVIRANESYQQTLFVE